MTDISVLNQGTILILMGESDAGRDWLAGNLDPEAQRWASGFVVEHRYVDAIIEGAVDAGLMVAPVRRR